MARHLARLMAIVTLALVGSFAAALPASAHGEDETMQGYILVQQALGHLAHDSSSGGIGLAMEKVDDALHADDHVGVDVPRLEQGMVALEAGNVDQARSLLQDSIREALASLPPATGNETGTTTLAPALAGRARLHPQDWGFLAAATLALVVGLWLAYLFRPHESVPTLRSLLGPSAGTAAAGSAPGRQGR